MKIGAEVWVCHDGKFGRRVKGVVVSNHYGNRIKVRFSPHDEIGEVEFWARKRPKISYSQKSKGSCVSYSKRPPNTFAGWADIDMWAPWFSVYKYRRSEEVK